MLKNISRIVTKMVHDCGDTYCTLAVKDGGDISGAMATLIRW